MFTVTDKGKPNAYECTIKYILPFLSGHKTLIFIDNVFDFIHGLIHLFQPDMKSQISFVSSKRVHFTRCDHSRTEQGIRSEQLSGGIV